MWVPHPAPPLLAIAVMPVLFDTSHSMWGVNTYSTLAGMISNSISFPIMILYIACTVRDAADLKFRFRTVFLLTALLASHFFTSVIAALTVCIIPFLPPWRNVKKAFLVVAAEGGTSTALPHSG